LERETAGEDDDDDDTGWFPERSVVSTSACLTCKHSWNCKTRCGILGFLQLPTQAFTNLKSFPSLSLHYCQSCDNKAPFFPLPSEEAVQKKKKKKNTIF
jgi:hypothetical protein